MESKYNKIFDKNYDINLEIILFILKEYFNSEIILSFDLILISSTISKKILNYENFEVYNKEKF